MESDKTFLSEFIEMYKLHPALWNVKSDLFKNKHFRAKGIDALVQLSKDKNVKTNLYDAKPLENVYYKTLFEDYNFNCHDDRVFSEIESHYTIIEVKKVNNPYMYGLYLLHKEELKQTMGTVVEELLYHCTSSSNALQIARNNIDWRLTRRSRYGKGACFSKSPRYASMKAGATGAFIVCRVLMRAVQNIQHVSYTLKIPCEGYDATLGNRGKVLVKYDDFTFYPEYIVYYRS